jgi:chromosome segregation ATPase
LRGLEDALEEERSHKRDTASCVLRLEKELRAEKEMYRGNSRELSEIESELRGASQERERADATLTELKRALQVTFVTFNALICHSRVVISLF